MFPNPTRLLAALFAGLLLVSPAPAVEVEDIPETAVAAGSFQTLVTALTESGLLPALKGDGPFTVFAPVDAAFARLPEGALNELLKTRSRTRLRAILKFHVVPGRFAAADLMERTSLPTLQGEALPVARRDGRLTVKGAPLLQTDIACRNGIIHVIDTVLMPETRTIPEVALAAGNFGTLLAAVEAAGLAGKLGEAGPFTVFAPTDDAFRKLPAGTLSELLRPANRDRLVALLAHHVVPGRIPAAAALRAGKARTLGGSELAIEGVRDGLLRVGGGNVIAPDVAAGNGVIHVVDTVLMPPAPVRGAAVRTLLELAIDRGVPIFNDGQVAACAAVYEVAAAGALEAGADLTDRETKALRDALAAARRADDAREGAWILRRAFDQVLESLGRPAPAASAAAPQRAGKEKEVAYVREAALPKGFPAPGPVGEVVVKDYPRYRAARAEGGSFAFGTLFAHIKRNDIAMTAPVEMAMSENPSGAMSTKSMAFLYATPELGQAGRDGRVEVLDLAPQRVLSYGMNGPVTSGRLADARRAIEARLESEGLSRDGEWRLMGYNSPMIPESKRFYEIQLPVASRP